MAKRKEDFVLRYLEEFITNDKIGLGEKSIYVESQTGKIFQVIKTGTHFVFHYVGNRFKGILAENCISKQQNINLKDYNSKKYFAISFEDIQKIIIGYGMVAKHGFWGSVNFKLKNHKSKFYVLTKTFEESELCAFFGKKLEIKNQKKSLVNKQALKQEIKKAKISGGLSEMWNKWDDLEDDEDIPDEELEKMEQELDYFAKKIAYGVKSIFLYTSNENYYQVIKMEDGFLFHYVGQKDIILSSCFPIVKYIDESTLSKQDFLLKHNKIKKIIINKKSNAGFGGIYGIIKFKLKGCLSKKFALYENIDKVNFKTFFGEKLNILNDGQSIADKLDAETMKLFQDKINPKE